jgi:hypothetical protein
VMLGYRRNRRQGAASLLTIRPPSELLEDRLVRPAASAGPGTPPAIDPQKPADPEARKGAGADATQPRTWSPSAMSLSQNGST